MLLKFFEETSKREQRAETYCAMQLLRQYMYRETDQIYQDGANFMSSVWSMPKSLSPPNLMQFDNE